jgi:hypothetical protein
MTRGVTRRRHLTLSFVPDSNNFNAIRIATTGSTAISQSLNITNTSKRNANTYLQFYPEVHPFYDTYNTKLHVVQYLKLSDLSIINPRSPFVREKYHLSFSDAISLRVKLHNEDLF